MTAITEITKERDALRTEVASLRAEVERMSDATSNGFWRREWEALQRNLRSSDDTHDFLRSEIERTERDIKRLRERRARIEAALEDESSMTVIADDRSYFEPGGCNNTKLLLGCMEDYRDGIRAAILTADDTASVTEEDHDA